MFKRSAYRQGRRTLHANHFLFVCLCLIIFSSNSKSQEILPDYNLLPFNAEYKARYRGFKAKANRSLSLDNGAYELHSQVELKLLGTVLSSINENSRFVTEDNQLFSQQYFYEQSGVGGRSRSQTYHWQENIVEANIDEHHFQMELTSPVLDELNAFMYLKMQVAAGQQDVNFQTFDKDRVEDYQYKVVLEEVIETDMGEFNAVRVERVRNADSKRSTTLWLATDWDYLLIKLEQIDPKNRKLELSLSTASIEDTAVSPL